jgi:hypothetical protein
MKRRGFLSAGLSLGAASAIGVASMNEAFGQASVANGNVQYFEWIRYHLHTGSKQGIVADYYRDTAIPALNKAGIKNVGVFNVKNGPNSPTLHVIIPHPSLESVVTLNDKLLEDSSFVQSGKRFLESPSSDTAFVRMEKSILKAFTNLPEIQIPEQKKQNKSRIFQVRIYESPNLTAAKKKIHMFNEGGEIAVFKKTGLQPVLFGEMIAGDKMPCLVYMLAFDNTETMAKNWSVFVNDPDWIALRDNPYYADTVSCINDWLWTPASCSQI